VSPASASGPAALGRVGFSRGADAYERGRPGYPDELVRRLARAAALGPGTLALDVAAGTGKLARQLAGAGARTLALEPSAAMRAEARVRTPTLPVVAGTAEALPLVAGCCALVTVAQAFHWLEPSAALAELARVLRPGGVAALVWNERDETVPWVAELGRILEPPESVPTRQASTRGPLLDGAPGFGPLEHWRLAHRQPVDLDGLVDLAGSRSWVSVLPAAERRALLARVRALGAAQAPPLVMPYRTEAFVARRRAG
jgi:SAM-dependent methyltransferase